MTPQEFAAKWHDVNLKERASAQEHFLDLCRMLGHATPAEADPDGTFFTFERGVEKTGGSQGFADVWFKGHFAWEYKRRHASLADAYKQLLQYRDNLDNPPLLVVCDVDTFEIHTNFTDTAKRVYRFANDQVPEPEHLAVLRALFYHPDVLKPEKTLDQVTEGAARDFARLAPMLSARGIEPHRAAHFLIRAPKRHKLSVDSRRMRYPLPSNTHIGNRCSCVARTLTPFAANSSGSIWVWHEETCFKH